MIRTVHFILCDFNAAYVKIKKSFICPIYAWAFLLQITNIKSLYRTN